uniref:Uncharacterized protein n=1 Tax=Glossina austeni TaxID=7395 RepID=A0A1A9UL31_GLOAU
MGVLRWRDLPGSRVSVGNHHNNNTANNQNNNHNSRGELGGQTNDGYVKIGLVNATSHNLVLHTITNEITVRLDEIKTAKLTRGANVPHEVLCSANMKTASVGLNLMVTVS